MHHGFRQEGKATVELGALGGVCWEARARFWVRADWSTSSRWHKGALEGGPFTFSEWLLLLGAWW
jgi:hypothetical protein